MKNFKKIFILLLICALALVLVGCNPKNEPGKKVYYDNETDKLIFSTQELDKVFNPFFSTSATDSNVVGMTQIGMLSNDAKGNPVYGDNEAVVTKDLQIITDGVKDVNQTTTYYFVLKNNVRFSNGSYLTMKDVLFNLYVYLDRAYTGSSTMYSTDIVGLNAYRTQEIDKNEQDNFNVKFEIKASQRISALSDACDEILKEHKNSESVDSAALRGYLVSYADALKGTEAYETFANIVDDYDKTLELFNEELNADYSNALNLYETTKFYDEEGKEYANLFTTDVEVFLYNEGYISWNKKEKTLLSSITNDLSTLKKWTKEQAIQYILNDKIPDSIVEILNYWNTAVNLKEFITNQEIEKYFAGNTTRKFPNIEGIKFINRKAPVTVNGVTYDVPEYNEDGSVKSGNEVLSITINGVDPKAIWNFSFAVAPMYYYSDEEHIKKFDYESNFGVEYNSQTFMQKVINSPDKIGVPVGAGAYAASKSDGGIQNIKGSDFYNLGVVYFERNPYFIMGPAKIKQIRFQVTPNSQMLNSLYSKKVDFVEPNAKPETITELNDKKDQGIGNKSITTMGYGYIGVNAGKVPDLKVRQAIMHSINTLETVSYYKTTAKAIYRSMSKESWAYPDGCTAYYPFVGGPVPEDLSVVNPDYAEYVTELGLNTGDVMTEAQQLAFIRKLVEDAGYTLNSNGVYVKGSNILKYTFTVAGETDDHPAWLALTHGGALLNKAGFQITVTTDAQALQKLASGALTVWAAAWGSTIDPDMYQVYHKDSLATSTLNWGYKQIQANVGGKYDTEKALIDELSELIDLGRQTTVREDREVIYSQALDIVMQLAIELPTYQRDDLFAYNTDKIDTSTFNQSPSAFKGLTSDLHNVSLVVDR